MPGRPRRDVTFERIIARNPAFALALGPEKPLKLSSEDNTFLLESTVKGLLKRLSLRNPKEAEVLRGSLPRLEEHFALLVSLGKRDAAEKELVTALSRFSLPQLVRRYVEPTFLELAHIAHGLLRTMPPKNKMKKRSDWVEKFGLNAGEAVESDSALVEYILAHNYNISESRVHKILAGASKFSR